MPEQLKFCGETYNFDQVYRNVEARTVVTRDRCEMLYRLSRYASAMPGDIAEVGVYKGGTSLLLKAANPHKSVHAFDTFDGIPNAAAADDCHQNGDFKLIDVRETVSGLVRSGITVHQGVFPQTAAGLEGPFCFIHVDGDTYQTTTDALKYFWPRMMCGGILVFDDFRWPKCPGVERAILEHCAVYGCWPFHTAALQVALTVCRAM